MAILYKKYQHFFSSAVNFFSFSCEFFSNFGHQKPGSETDWFQLKMLDPDPEINVFGSKTLVLTITSLHLPALIEKFYNPFIMFFTLV